MYNSKIRDLKSTHLKVIIVEKFYFNKDPLP